MIKKIALYTLSVAYMLTAYTAFGMESDSPIPSNLQLATELIQEATKQLPQAQQTDIDTINKKFASLKIALSDFGKQIPEKVNPQELTRRLLNAIYNNNLPSVKKFIKQGADVNKSDYANTTPLVAAIEEGNMPLVKYLVEAGASVNPPAYEGQLPLVAAVMKKNIALVKYLVNKGANINVLFGGRNTTPLTYARTYDLTEIAKFLEEKGAITQQEAWEKLR